MENHRESLKSKIASLYGEEILGTVNRFTKLRKSLHVQLCSLTFLKRCRDQKVVPKCLQLKSHINTRQAKTILEQAALRLVKERISATKRQLDITSRSLLTTHLLLASTLQPELWLTLDRITFEQSVRCGEQRSNKQKQKFAKQNTNDRTPALIHTVKNLSQHHLSPHEITVLAKGHNFAITPNKIPTEEIISQIETTIFRLPQDVSNQIRHQVTNVLQKASPPQPNISKEERLALKSLKNNQDIIILPADKGNTTVVMDKTDYTEKMKILIDDTSTYNKIKRDPTSGLERKTTELLKKSKLEPELIKYLSPKESLPPRLYGLPKIHKTNIPLRPIVSNIGSPTYTLAKFLTKPLQKLTKTNQYFIENSTDFVRKIQKIKTQPEDILVSFDVESLFTNIPITETLDIIKRSGHLDKNLLPLVKHCLTSTYFQFQGEFYEQTSGAAMGSPISPIIANIFMEHFENETLRKARFKPSTWFRYVDDTFVIWPHGPDRLTDFLTFLNSQHPNIKFTMEVERDRKIPFLDVLIQRKDDNSLGYKVYRKPTHTDRYLHASSHHHPAQKNSVVSSLVYRALTISQDDNLEHELSHLTQALISNGYSKSNINRVINRLKNKISHNTQDTENEVEATNNRTFLPYIQGTTDRISKILQKHKIRTIFKPPKKIGQLLPNPKDPRAPLSNPGVYKIPCSCGKVYIGETGRKISTRIKEHERCTRLGHYSKSALAEHWLETGHTAQYDKSEMIAPSQGYFSRKHREALEILKHPTNLNRDNGYQVNPIWHTVLPVF